MKTLSTPFAPDKICRSVYLATLGALLLLLFLAVGCQQRSPYIEFYNEQPNDVLIFFERTGCFGECPTYQLFLFGNGTVYLRNNPSSKELSIGNADNETFRLLLREFEKRDFFKFDEKYRSQVTDQPATSIGLEIGSEHKYVYNSGKQGPKSLEQLESLLDEVKDRILFSEIEMTWDRCNELYSKSLYYIEENRSQIAQIYCGSLFKQ